MTIHLWLEERANDWSTASDTALWGGQMTDASLDSWLLPHLDGGLHTSALCCWLGRRLLLDPRGRCSSGASAEPLQLAGQRAAQHALLLVLSGPRESLVEAVPH